MQKDQLNEINEKIIKSQETVIKVQQEMMTILQKEVEDLWKIVFRNQRGKK